MGNDEIMYLQAKHNIKNSISSERGNVQNNSQWKNKVIQCCITKYKCIDCEDEVYTECVHNVYATAFLVPVIMPHLDLLHQELMSRPKGVKSVQQLHGTAFESEQL